MVVLGDGAVSCQRGTPVGCRVRIGVGTRIRQLRHPGTLETVKCDGARLIGGTMLMELTPHTRL